MCCSHFDRLYIQYKSLHRFAAKHAACQTHKWPVVIHVAGVECYCTEIGKMTHRILCIHVWIMNSHADSQSFTQWPTINACGDWSNHSYSYLCTSNNSFSFKKKLYMICVLTYYGSRLWGVGNVYNMFIHSAGISLCTKGVLKIACKCVVNIKINMKIIFFASITML